MTFDSIGGDICQQSDWLKIIIHDPRDSLRLDLFIVINIVWYCLQEVCNKSDITVSFLFLCIKQTTYFPLLVVKVWQFKSSQSFKLVPYTYMIGYSRHYDMFYWHHLCIDMNNNDGRVLAFIAWKLNHWNLQPFPTWI